MSGWNWLLLPREKKPSRISWMMACSSSLLLDELHRAVAGRAARGHFVRLETEQEEILDADFLADLDVGAVHRADRQRAVHLELHVAGAGRFLAGGGNLLRQIRGRIDLLAVGHVEVGQIDDLDEIAHARIAIDDLGGGGDQPDDELGEVVARRRLAAEHEHARLHRELRIGLQPMIETDDVQDVQVLALVFVDALHLHVEDRRRDRR